MPPASVPHWDARAFYPSSVSAAQQFAALPLNQTHFWISFYPWKGACATAQKPKTNMKTDWGEGCYICIGLEESRELQTAFIVLGSQKQKLADGQIPSSPGQSHELFALVPKWEKFKFKKFSSKGWTLPNNQSIKAHCGIIDCTIVPWSTYSKPLCLKCFELLPHCNNRKI